MHTQPAIAPYRQAAPATRQAQNSRASIGVLSALLVWGFFIFPVTAYPIQAMGFELLLLLLAALGLWIGALRSLVPRALLPCFLLSLWSFIRWRTMDVVGAGREPALALLWLSVGCAAGLFLGLLDNDSPQPAPLPANSKATLEIRPHPSSGAVAAFRGTSALAATGFGAWALVQFFFIYPHSLATLRATMQGPAQDLATQSLIEALSLRRIGGGLGNPNIFAGQLALLAWFSLAQLGPGSARATKRIGALGYAATFAALLLTRSRGGMIAYAVATFVALFALRREHRAAGPPTRSFSPVSARSLIMLAISIAALTFCIAAQVPPSTPAPAPAAATSPIASTKSATPAQTPTPAKPATPAVFHETLAQRLTNIGTIRERLYYWQVALRIWHTHPIIGAGPGGFALHYGQFRPDAAGESQYAHSWVLQWLAELGIVGLLLAAWMWGEVLNFFLSAGRHREAWWLTGGALLLGFDGLFEFSLQWREFLILLGILIGGAAAQAAAPRLQHPAPADHSTPAS